MTDAAARPTAHSAAMATHAPERAPEGAPEGALGPAEARSGAAGRLIAIASGKGGVGKTWFSITLAHVLARRGGKVLLFDADLGLANVDVQLGLTPALDLADVIAGRASIDQAAMRHPEGGFHILAGRSGSGMFSGLQPVLLERMLAELRGATGRFDHVLLDLGAGLEHSVRRMAAFADTLLVIATEEPTSLTDAYAVLKLHAADRADGDARVIVNQAASRGAGERTYATLRRACATFLGREPVLSGVIRRDDRVREAIRRQALLLTRHPACAAAADVAEIGRGLLM
jgi:flagellar biosynthesis protein FlhG